MPIAESVGLDGLTYSQLYTRIGNTIAEATTVKGRLDDLNAEVAKRLGESIKKALADDGKEHGTANLSLQDGITAKGVVDKKVEWDSAKLLAIAQTMPWNRAVAVFKIVFSVPEKIYAGIKAVDPDLLKLIDAARTTKHGEPKITLIKE